jgi:hypothetical protein
MADNVVGKATVKVNADTAGAEVDIERFRRRLEATGRSYDKLLKQDITRKFSENFRVGFEQGVLRGLEKGENQFYQLNRAINVASTSLHKIKGPAEMAADRFMKLQKTGIKFQAAAGTISGSVGDLVGGMYSLVGVLGAVAPSFVALGGAMAGVGVGFIGVKVAMAGVSNAISTVWQSQTALNDTFRAARQEYIGLKFAAEEAALSQESAALKLESAREALARVQDLPPDNRLRRQTELAFKQADLQLREAKHKSEESFRAVKKGIEATNAYQPLAPLSAVQLQFVKFMVTLRPQMQQLKKEVAAGFIPKLQESIETLMKYGFPVLKDGLKQVASAMGNASKTFASAFKDSTNILNLGNFFKDATKTIGHFGDSVKSSFGILLTLLSAASRVTERFSKFIDKSLGNFDKKLRLQNFNGDLNRSFQLAFDVANQLGRVFKEIWGGVKNIVKAAFPSGVNSGAGKVMLDFLHSISRAFMNFTGKDSFATWLKDATVNAVEALKTVGKFLAIFTDLAGNKQTKEFWIIIREAVPYIRQILEAGQTVGADMAKVLVSITKLVAALAEEGTLKSFFASLKIIIDAFANVITFLAPVLAVIGAAHGPLLAIGGVFIILKKGLEIFLGYLAKFSNMMGGATAKLRSDRAGMLALRREYDLTGKAGYDMWSRIRQSARSARNSQLLEMGREAGYAKNRLAELELQMISSSRASHLYNDSTKETVVMLQMETTAAKGAASQAQQMANRIIQQAQAAKMDAAEVKLLTVQLKENIQAARGASITNQELLRGTSLAGGNYKAPYVSGAGAMGPGGVPMAPGTMLTGGRPGVGGIRAGFKGLFGGIGGTRPGGPSSMAGGLGMGAMAVSSLASLGTGTMSQTGMVMQSLAGVASMFGPAGMVAGGLLSVGTTIVDGVIAAENKRMEQIKEFKITTANMSVQNMNEIKDFGSKALQAGLVKTKSEASLQAIAFKQTGLKNFGEESGSIKSASDLAAATKQFALVNQKAYNLSKSVPMQDIIQQTIATVAGTTALTKEEVGSVLGNVAGITAKSQDSVLQNLVDTGVVSQEYLKTLTKDLKYGDKGTLTQGSFKTLMKDIAIFGQTPYMLNGGANPLGLPTSGFPSNGLDATRLRRGDYEQTQFLPGVTGLNYAPISKVLGPKLTGISYTNSNIERGLFNQNYKLPKVSASVNNAGLTGLGDLLTSKKLFKVNQFGGIDYNSPEAQQQAISSVSNIAQMLTGKVGGTITKENRRYYDYQGARYDEASFAKVVEKIPYANLKEYKKQYGQTEKGYNVAGTYFNEDLFKKQLGALKIKDAEGNVIDAAEAFKKVSVDVIAKIGEDAITGGTGNAIIDSVTKSATEQITTFKTATQNTKDAAAQIGTAAAKFEGYGTLIANNTNKAIAFAIVAASREGKAALADNNYDKITTLLNDELKKLGLVK